MMEQNPARPARKVAISDRLWEAFEEMASQMGSDRDGLVNQAMFMFARLNGFLEASGAQASPGGGSLQSLKSTGSSSPRLGPPVLAPVSNKDSGAARRGMPEEKSHAGKLDDDPVRREVAERVLETAAELERLIKGKNDARGEERENSDASDDEAEPMDDLEGDAGLDEEEQSGARGQLYLMAEGGEMDKITKERFVIGRGKHCDFVINSGKVSREHAVITRENGEYFIEDLGSSNGTWFNKQRIKRRKVDDGDEYYICSEKIKLVMR